MNNAKSRKVEPSKLLPLSVTNEKNDNNNVKKKMEHCEINWHESLNSLRKYEKLLRENQGVVDKVLRERQATIDFLIQQLLKAQECQQTVMSKCVQIAQNIQREFKDLKNHVSTSIDLGRGVEALPAKRKMIDQWVQYEDKYFPITMQEVEDKEEEDESPVPPARDGMSASTEPHKFGTTNETFLVKNSEGKEKTNSATVHAVFSGKTKPKNELEKIYGNPFITSLIQQPQNNRNKFATSSPVGNKNDVFGSTTLLSNEDDSSKFCQQSPSTSKEASATTSKATSSPITPSEAQSSGQITNIFQCVKTPPQSTKTTASKPLQSYSPIDVRMFNTKTRSIPTKIPDGLYPELDNGGFYKRQSTSLKTKRSFNPPPPGKSKTSGDQVVSGIKRKRGVKPFTRELGNNGHELVQTVLSFTNIELKDRQ